MGVLTHNEIAVKLYGIDNPSLTAIDIYANVEIISEILRLKKKHNVLMLGHNYMEPLVFDLSAKDEQGDSLGLSMHAANTDCEYIIFNGVPFMAETAKILNPDKRVFVADKAAGCSLADNFNASQIRELKQKYPGVPVMIYINSYADCKAESDVVCTSANAIDIAKKMSGDKIIFVPDILFAQNLAEDLNGVKEVIYPSKNNSTKGSICEVHEKFTLQDLEAIRESFDIPKSHPRRMIYAHWECKPEVLREADFYGSTSDIRRDIANRVKKESQNRLERAFIASECELTANLSKEFPNVRFWTACSVRCQHMAKVTLQGIYAILKSIDDKNENDLSKCEIILPEEVVAKARKPILKMLELSKI